MKPLVSTDWLNKNLENVRIFDASWHLPGSDRNSFQEYKKKHIKNSLFFDIDKNSNRNSSLPHMLTTKEDWEKILSEFGINNSDHVVIYDNSDVISSCRVWYNFLYFGHDSDLISVLDGGLKKWLIEKRSTDDQIKNFEKSIYKANENSSLVINKDEIDSNIKTKLFDLIDARSKERFLGKQKEIRKNLRSGNIPGSKNLPFGELINKLDGTFKSKNELIDIFANHKINTSDNLAFTCGSGITASILGLANSIISGKKPLIYDGSWSEYGLSKNENNNKN
tara:strand:+ start:1250 stop:2089 length:840 start_codon:yes stop_codon:yes gene_type:complete